MVMRLAPLVVFRKTNNTLQIRKNFHEKLVSL